MIINKIFYLRNRLHKFEIFFGRHFKAATQVFVV